MSLFEAVFGGLKVQDLLVLVIGLIFIYLVVTNYQGVNTLLTSTAGASIAMTRTLQGR